jgi:type 1 glutamine amidotransferase
MKKILSVCLTFLLIFLTSESAFPEPPIRVLVITGGHDYNKNTFNAMFSSMGDIISYTIAEFPSAYDMFSRENRNKYDVLVFYHMWQKITQEQEKILAECIREGKPLVALHHSICAFDDWPEYFSIVGGKYFHKPTTVNGKTYPVSSYIHDLHFKVIISNPDHPVTKGLKDFEVFDETYKDYYVEAGVTPLLTTIEPTSTPVIGWTKKYGKARVVTLQSGHDTPTFENPNFRKLLKQSIEWVYKGK